MCLAECATPVMPITSTIAVVTFTAVVTFPMMTNHHFPFVEANFQLIDSSLTMKVAYVLPILSVQLRVEKMFFARNQD